MRQFEVGTFQTLVQPTRIFLLAVLSPWVMAVGELCDDVSISQSSASQLRAVLRNELVAETCKKAT
jgi:hypothetical protein